MDTLERTPLWENTGEQTVEFTRFNLVIRLSKVRQLTILFLDIFVPPLLPLFVYLGVHPTLLKNNQRNIQKHSLLSALQGSTQT